jgi:hypothetical protein
VAAILSLIGTPQSDPASYTAILPDDPRRCDRLRQHLVAHGAVAPAVCAWGPGKLADDIIIAGGSDIALRLRHHRADARGTASQHCRARRPPRR